VPTVAETIPGFEVTSWWAIVAPPATPAPIAEQLSAAIAEAVKSPDVARKLSELSMVPQGGTPSELSRLIAAEAARWGEVIRASGVRAE